MMNFAENVRNAAPGRTCVFSLGQAGFLIRSASGKLLGIDLYLSDCVERVEGHVGYKRLLPRLLEPGELLFDVLIATHFHRDHFDVDSMHALLDNGHTRLFASCDCVNDVSALKLPEERVTFVKPGSSARIEGFGLDFINCDHGMGAPEAVGVIVTADGKRILETGDTCLRMDRVPEYISAGPVDIMIAPINGAYGNLNEADCVALAEAVRPGLTIPCHYGMFASHGGDPGIFHTLMSEKNLPYMLLAMGDSYAFQGE